LPLPATCPVALDELLSEDAPANKVSAKVTALGRCALLVFQPREDGKLAPASRRCRRTKRPHQL
jgi:hypothetical protein